MDEITMHYNRDVSCYQANTTYFGIKIHLVSKLKYFANTSVSVPGTWGAKFVSIGNVGEAQEFLVHQ